MNEFLFIALTITPVTFGIDNLNWNLLKTGQSVEADEA